MFDLSWSHMMIFALVAIILVPPKDLPVLMRTIGRYVGQMRRMANEFRSQFDEALKEAELAEIRDSVAKEVRDIEKAGSVSDIERSVNSSMAAATAAPAAAAPQPVAPLAPAAGETPAASAAPAEAGSGTVAATPATQSIIPTSPAVNGSEHAFASDEAMSTGRGSVAQRAAAAWKKAAGDDSGAATS